MAKKVTTGVTYLLCVRRTFDHLHFCSVVRPRIILQDLSNLPPQAEGSVQVFDIVRQSTIIGLKGCLACFWIVGIFKLGRVVR